MNRAKIKYEIVDKLSRDIKSNINKDWIEFDDGYIVYLYAPVIINKDKLQNCHTIEKEELKY